MKISFIHTADLHLGKQFKFKHMRSPYGDFARESLFSIFGKMINTAKKNKIDFLLLSGDIFDTPQIGMQDLDRFVALLSRIPDTEVIILPGNHDFYQKYALYGLVDFPKNVHVFKNDSLEEFSFPEKKTRIFGLAWTKDTYREFPFSGRVDLREEDNNIIMLHGDATHSSSEHMPINISDFDYFDYVALGHIHQHQFLTKRIAYCGAPQPFSFKDSGNFGMIVGQLEKHRLETHFIVTQTQKFITLDIDVTPDMTIDDIKESCLETAGETNYDNNLYRFVLTGYAKANMNLNLLDDILADHFYYVETDTSRIQPDWDIEKILASNKDNVIGHFIKTIGTDPKDPVSKKALYYGLEGLMMQNGGET